MGGCLSKGKEDAGAEKSKNSPKSSTKSSTISASETEERAIRVQREDKKGITTTAPSKIPRIVTPSTKPNLETKPQAEAQAAKTAPARTLESKSSIPVRSLTPTPPPRVVSVQLSTPSPPPQAELRAPSPLPERRTPSPLPERRTPSPSQSKVPVPAQTGERRTGTTPPPSTNGAAVPENRRSSIPLPQTKVVLPERMISGLSMAVSTAEVPERKVSPVGSLKLERKPSAAESLKLERKISPLERTIAATPPPPAPTPPPCAPTPPPMPPTPPPARGSMSTISEEYVYTLKPGIVYANNYQQWNHLPSSQRTSPSRHLWIHVPWPFAATVRTQPSRQPRRPNTGHQCADAEPRIIPGRS